MEDIHDRHLHFRQFGPGTAFVSDRQCCIIVDICTNYACIDRLHTAECTTLFHLHWEDTDSGSETSSITVTEAKAQHESTVITPDLVSNLLKDKAALHDFTRKMLTAHRVKLIHMEYAPLAMTFEHCSDSDREALISVKHKVLLLVKEFVKQSTGFERLETLNIEIHEGKPISFGNLTYQRCMANVGIASSTGHKETPHMIPDTIEKRFNSIEEQLSHQKKFMESQFVGQDKQYDDIRLSLCNISSAMSDNSHNLWKVNCEQKVQQNILDLPETDLERLDSIYPSETDILSDEGEKTHELQREDMVGVNDNRTTVDGDTEMKVEQDKHDDKSERENNCVEDEACPHEVDVNGTSFGNKGENHQHEHTAQDIKQNPVPQQKFRFQFERSHYNDERFASKESNRSSGIRRQYNDEVNDGNVYPGSNYRGSQYVNLYDSTHPTSRNRYRTTYGPAVSARCQLNTTAHNTQYQRRQTSSLPRLQDLLFGPSGTASESDAFPDIQTEDLNFDLIRSTQRIASAQESKYGEPTKEKIDGDEQKEKHFRLMLECIIGDSPYWSRIWASVEEALLEDETPVPRFDLALDTVICMDTSSSMWGDPFHEMKKITTDFINEKIKPGGPSPIMEGVLVSMACLAKGGVFKISSSMQLRPRIIFITDGLPTREMPETSQDSMFTEEKDKERISRAFAEIRSRQLDDYLPDEIVFVPVGISCNMNCLQALASFCGGTVADTTSVTKLPKYQFLHKSAIRAIDYIRDNDQDSALFPAGLQGVFMDLEPGLDSSDRRIVYNILAPKVDALINHGSVNNFQNIHEDPGLPPLGSRVVRGPDWLWGNQDTEGPGTIFNHALDNIVWVMWDNDHSNAYRYGQKDKYDVITVEDQPRVLNEYLIAVGVQVERGPDWHLLYGNQDGGPGSYGSVIRVMVGKVKVRWQSGRMYAYRYGIGGMFDLSIRDPVASILETTAKSEVYSCNTSGYEGVQTLQEDRPHVWQRQDKQNGWESYTELNDAKLKKEYGKNSQGSCLVQRHGESFRVSFKSLQERSVTDKTWVPVRKYFE
ncbi:uncharacterized protein [Haliotis cracherodii]|uniref:uncharacterized protein isoform X2 n=1 Tax=Haliotis cracherodii TaxID=6455 RepID=UPI0039ED1D87